VHQISSNLTFYYKRIFPVTWFGILAIFLVAALASGLSGKESNPMLLIMPVVMAVVGYFFMKRLVFDLVDKVFDAGSALVVRNGNQEDRIELSDIANVSYSVFMNPPRVTLLLRKPGLFGDRVTFCAPIRFVPFASSPVIDELIRRIDASRRP
jgi:hypothetical protein